MSTEIVSVRDVRRIFPTSRGPLRALDGVDLTISSGESLGLVGESGSGKTTLARILMGMDRPTSGTVTTWGKDLLDLERRERAQLRRRLGVVFQDPYSSLNPKLSLQRIIAEPLEIQRVGTKETRRARVEYLLEAVGLDPAWKNRRASQLSGGQRQRVAIARAIALEPDLLILDEPVSGLDVSVQAQVLNVLADLQDRMQFASLFISHDLAVVRHVADRIAVMYLGRIVEEGLGVELLAGPQHPYTIALLSSALEMDAEAAPGRILLHGDPPSAISLPEGCRFRSRCFRAEEPCASVDPTLQPLANPDHRAACLFPGVLGSRERDPGGRSASPRSAEAVEITTESGGSST
jgi:oligopeptide transport system ATP-binding protein